MLPLRGDPAWIARATRSLPVPLSPVISTVRSLPCRRWIWSATRCIAALAQTKPGQQRLELPLERAGAGLRLALARLAQIESLAQHRAQRAEALAQRPAAAAASTDEHGEARAVGVAADRLELTSSARRRRVPRSAAAASARAASASQPAAASTRNLPGRQLRRRARPPARRTPRAAPSRPRARSSAGITDASTIRRTSASSPSICTPT